MATLLRFLQSSILSKVVMAATGLILVLFLLGHMIGNLQMYAGQDTMNTYAETLQGLGGLLWIIRSSLLLCLVLHILTSIRLWTLNNSARPVEYKKKSWVRATLSSRTMIWTGALVFFFLLYHLLHLTVGSTNPDHYALTDMLGRHDVYSMVIVGYKNVLISSVYLISMILLAYHLSHAISSMFQTLGINHPKYNPLINGLGPVVSIVLATGFLSVPLGVLFGWIQLPAGG